MPALPNCLWETALARRYAVSARFAVLEPRAALPPRCHFQPADDELILSYCQTVLQVRSLNGADDYNSMRMLSIARRDQRNTAVKLRIAPAGRMGPKTAGRMAARNSAAPASAYDTLTDIDDD